MDAFLRGHSGGGGSSSSSSSEATDGFSLHLCFFSFRVFLPYAGPPLSTPQAIATLLTLYSEILVGARPSMGPWVVLTGCYRSGRVARQVQKQLEHPGFSGP